MGTQGQQAGTFGEFVRSKRKAKKIGLREMARKIEVSPTYLSIIERNRSEPPVEEKIRAIAKLIGHDEDELLAIANRTPDEITRLVEQRQLWQLLRTLKAFEAKYASVTPGEYFSWLATIFMKQHPREIKAIVDDFVARQLVNLATTPWPEKVADRSHSRGAINLKIAEWINREQLSAELSETIENHPKKLAAFVRAAKRFDADDWDRLLTSVKGPTNAGCGKVLRLGRKHLRETPPYWPGGPASFGLRRGESATSSKTWTLGWVERPAFEHVRARRSAGALMRPNHRPPIDFDQINSAALACWPQLLQSILPGGRFDGNEYVVLNPTRSDGQPGSFKINVRGPKAGVWEDFKTRENGGDPVSLCAYVWGVRQGEAATRLADMLNVAARTDRDSDSGSGPQSRATGAQPNTKPVRPIPEDAPPKPTTHPTRGKPSSTWTYRNGTGQPLFEVWRFETPSGKEIRPLSLGRSSTGLKWEWKSLPEPRPLVPASTGLSAVLTQLW